MIRFSFLSILLTTAVAAAQDRPFAFLSISAQEPATGSPQRSVPSLLLRANNELPYYVYVRNPGTDDWDKLTVALAVDDKATNVIAEGSVAKVAGGETVRVKMSVKSPAAPVAEKPAEGKAPPPPSASPLPSELFLVLLRATEENPRSIVKAMPVSVRIMSPKEYLDVSTATPAGVVASNNNLFVQIGDKNKAVPFRGKPVKVSLNVRPDLITGLDTSAPREGTYDALVAPGAEKITLAAKNLRFTGSDRGGYFSISADGVANAFVYQVDFRGTSPRPVEDNGFLNIDVPRFAVTGKPLVARLEIFGDETGGQPRLRFFRSDVGAPEVVTAGVTAPRDQKTGIRGGDNGELVVTAEVKDWAVSLDTAGLYGARTLTFDLDNAKARFKAAAATVVFDDTAPIGVEFVKPPASAQKGKKFRVTARAEDRESGLKPGGVLFFIGDPPAEGKKPAKGMVASGTPNADGTFSADFDVPDVKGAFDVSVRFTNNVGLTSEKTHEVFAIEAPTTGTIEGRVVQGNDRGQPGLEVLLVDAEGKKLDATKTDAKGNFKFTGLKPGAYIVGSAKPIDYNSKATGKATVVAGETAKVVLSLMR